MTLPPIKIFADLADVDAITRLARDPLYQGFTTNPTLMRRAGIPDYEAFGRAVLAAVPDRPVSLEVFADDLPTMEAQGRIIGGWGANVVVKVPITNTKGESTGPVVERLSRSGIVVNVTAILNVEQVAEALRWLDPAVPAMVSVFAGRIADTGRDPLPMMVEALRLMAKGHPRAELIWASPRELLNLFQAAEIGCHIITVTPDILAKLPLIGKDLGRYSLETVEMFHRDAAAAGYGIRTAGE